MSGQLYVPDALAPGKVLSVRTEYGVTGHPDLIDMFWGKEIPLVPPARHRDVQLLAQLRKRLSYRGSCKWKHVCIADWGYDKEQSMLQTEMVSACCENQTRHAKCRVSLDAFTQTGKKTISFIISIHTSVCLSACINSASAGTDLCKIWYWWLLLISVKKIRDGLKSDKNKRRFT